MFHTQRSAMKQLLENIYSTDPDGFYYAASQILGAELGQIPRPSGTVVPNRYFGEVADAIWTHIEIERFLSSLLDRHPNHREEIVSLLQQYKAKTPSNAAHNVYRYSRSHIVSESIGPKAQVVQAATTLVKEALDDLRKIGEDDLYQAPTSGRTQMIARLRTMNLSITVGDGFSLRESNLNVGHNLLATWSSCEPDQLRSLIQLFVLHETCHSVFQNLDDTNYQGTEYAPQVLAALDGSADCFAIDSWARWASRTTHSRSRQETILSGIDAHISGMRSFWAKSPSNDQLMRALRWYLLKELVRSVNDFDRLLPAHLPIVELAPLDTDPPQANINTVLHISISAGGLYCVVTRNPGNFEPDSLLRALLSDDSETIARQLAPAVKQVGESWLDAQRGS
jgi:hypothetical protein